MASTLILAVAGSGKTTHLVKQLSADKHALLITYTDNNCDTLRARVRKEFGHIPDNIRISTYFTFLYGFGVKPFLFLKERPKGINYAPAPIARDRARYFDGGNRMYSGRIAMYLDEQGVVGDIKTRLHKYYDLVLIDEVQDFGGRDFNLLLQLLDAGPNITLVGDFYQHTYDTSRDGNVNRNLHKTLDGYKARFEAAGVTIVPDLLERSHRCSPTICAFVRDRMGIDIQSHRNDQTSVELITEQARADAIYMDDHIIKLFYQQSAKYSCHADNWGNVKGIDGYGDVCVVLNPTTLKAYNRNRLAHLAPITKNKLYVAITRARGNVYFVSDSLYARYKRA